MISNVEQRIIRLERITVDVQRRTDNVLAKLGRVGQQLQGVRAGSRRCITTITGRIVGGDAAGAALVGSSLQVIGATTLTSYGTFSVPTGDYSIDLELDGSDTSVNLLPTGPGARFGTGASFTRAVAPCISNALAAVRPNPATGYRYLTGSAACQYPVSETLNWSDSLRGISGTTTFNPGGTGQWESGCRTTNSYAAGSCPARATTPAIWIMRPDLLVFLQWYAASNFAPICPINASCPTTTAFAFQTQYLAASITAKTCPDQTNTFDCTWAATDQMWHNNTASTIRFWE